MLNIVQTLLNDDGLYDSIVDLPNTKDLMALVVKIATNPKFKYIESES